MKRKGGQQQRIKAARSEEESSAAGIAQQSALVTFLLTLFTWGEFSPQRCQHIAALALEDLEKHHTNRHIVSDLKALASIGSNGAYPNKMHQDLMQRTKNISKVPQPYLFNAKFKSPVGAQNQSLLLPHELFATIAAEYQTTWFKSICPNQSNLETFWETAVNHPLLHDHPVLHREHWRRYAVPIALHGDGVPVVGIGKAWTKLLNVFSWFSLVGTGTTRSKLFTPTPVGTRSVKDHFQTVAWVQPSESSSGLSIGFGLANGLTETTREKYPQGSAESLRAGKPLAQGFFGLLFALTGDLDYFANALNLPHFAKKQGCCSVCRCDEEGEVSWTDFNPNAAWTNSHWTRAEWLAWPQRSKCQLFNLPGAFSALVALDFMHSKYLGSDQLMYGSVLTLLVFHMLPETPEANLARIWQEIRAWYNRNPVPVRFRYLNKLSVFVRQSGFPKLRGEAAEIRIALMLKLNYKIETLLTDFKDHYAFPEPAASEFKQNAFGMYALQMQIMKHFLDEDLQLFSVTSKSHMVLESVLLCDKVSPRLLWTFAGEDQMAKTQLLAKACVKGNSPAQATMKMSQHYRLGLHFVFKDHELRRA
ncbi:unnamed protein product [Durusdinium trenchii]|uniref:Uncharacterized protein n=1 Tax=Durusdinium trenchii TaxID=1381693 RepID=A0ABP0LB77_9DINO